MSNYTYYDVRDVLLRSSVKEVEEALKYLVEGSTAGPLEVAKFPSGHKVWRIRNLGMAPTIEFSCDEEMVRSEPSHECSLEPMLSDWEVVQ